jgi:hypothetical protein
MSTPAQPAARWPKTIDVAGRRVRLRFVELGDVYGQYTHDSKTIEVHSGITDPEKLLTIRHELMESSLLLSGVGFSEAYEQEPIVRCMEEIFFPAWDLFQKRLARLNS